MPLFHTDMTQVVEILPQVRQDKVLSILHSQYHACLCPGDARSQDISNHDINCVQPNQFGPRMLMIN